MLLEPSHLRRLHAVVPLLPIEVSRLADSGLPADLPNRYAVVSLLQNVRVRELRGFIVFRSSQPEENMPENSNFERPSFRGADQRKDRMMKRSRFTEEQVIALLREQEAALSTPEVCRKHGIRTAS